MLKILLAIEVLAMIGYAIALKKNRTLAENIIPAVIVVLANYLTWQI